MAIIVTPEGTAIPEGMSSDEMLRRSLLAQGIVIPERPAPTPDPVLGPDAPVGPFIPTSKEELAALQELNRQRPGSAEFANRQRPGRGKRMEKLSGRLRAARMKGGRLGQVVELGSMLGNRAITGRGMGLLPGNVGMLRGLGGLGALAALGYFGGKMGYDILQGETNLFGPSKRDQALADLAGRGSAQQYEEAARARRMASAMESQRMQRSIMENLQQVAQNNPALYNQVSAGRKLPRGAVVLGGQQRQDLLTELARAMDSGAFRQQDPLSDLIG